MTFVDICDYFGNFPAFGEAEQGKKESMVGKKCSDQITSVPETRSCSGEAKPLPQEDCGLRIGAVAEALLALEQGNC